MGEEDMDSASASIISMIRASERSGMLPTNVTISDKAAKQLAREFSYLQYKPVTSSLEIYLDLKAGKCKFMDVTLTVAG